MQKQRTLFAMMTENDKGRLFSCYGNELEHSKRFKICILTQNQRCCIAIERAVILRVSVCTLKLELFASSKLHIEFKHFQCACAYVCIELESFVFNYRHSFLYFFAFFFRKKLCLAWICVPGTSSIKIEAQTLGKTVFLLSNKILPCLFFPQRYEIHTLNARAFLGKRIKKFSYKKWIFACDTKFGFNYGLFEEK